MSMKNRESVSEYRIPELAIEGEVYNELQQDEELDKISNELEAKARAAEKAGEGSPEKTWAEHMAEVGEFNKEKAEEAVERDKPNAEELEKKTTAAYEAEIMALDKFAESADFLNEPIEAPTKTDLIRKWGYNYTASEHRKEFIDWLNSRDLSPTDKEYRKSLLKQGIGTALKKKVALFYKSSEDIKELWERDIKAEVEYQRRERVKDFLKQQDELEDVLRKKVAEYDLGEEPASEKLEMINGWLKGRENPTPEQTDLLIDWLESDSGGDKEKQYRALTKVKLSERITRFYNRENYTELSKSPAGCMYLGCSEKLKEKLKTGELSEEFAELTDEEKEARWKEMTEKRREEIDRREKIKKEEERYASMASKKAEEPKENLKEVMEQKAAKEKQREDEEWRKRLLDDSSSSTDTYQYSSPFDFPMAG